LPSISPSVQDVPRLKLRVEGWRPFFPQFGQEIFLLTQEIFAEFEGSFWAPSMLAMVSFIAGGASWIKISIGVDLLDARPSGRAWWRAREARA
jgi:hypothetical protein